MGFAGAAGGGAQATAVVPVSMSDPASAQPRAAGLGRVEVKVAVTG